MGFEMFTLGVNLFTTGLLLIVTFTGLSIAADKKWFAWYIALLGQLILIVYAVAIGKGQITGWPIVFAFIFAMNGVKWHAEHLNKQKLLKEMRENKNGSVVLPSGVEVTYNTIEDDSNLVRHARRELETIGEEPEVINWYLRVIREYASFGHSGGSHFAMIRTLHRLLKFQPLTKLTNDPNEWMMISPEHWPKEEVVWQNVRDSRAFSNDGGETYTLVDDRRNEYGKLPVYTSECNICFANRDKDEFTCPGCGAVTGTFVKDEV